MKNYVLLINDASTNNTGVTFEQIEKHLKTEFTSYDYMKGFFDGYLFDEYTLLSLKKYEQKVKMESNTLKNKYLKFVTVLEGEKEDEYEY